MEKHKRMKTAFAGHRHISIDEKELKNRLVDAIKMEVDNGCLSFTMGGVYGKFDKIALSACRYVRKEYKNIEIEVVFTSLHQIEKSVERELNGKIVYSYYGDVKTVIYDVENEFYKNKIISSNKQMIDDCDTLICYINSDNYRSGAKKTMKYAIKKGLKVINLYREKDDPFYNMTEEEKEAWFKRFLNS